MAPPTKKPEPKPEPKKEPAPKPDAEDEVEQLPGGGTRERPSRRYQPGHE